VVVVGTTIWVGIDASKRDWSGGNTGTAGWVVGCIALWIVVFPVHVAKRGKAPLKDTPASPAALSPSGASYRSARTARSRCAATPNPARTVANPRPRGRLHARWWYRATEQEPWQWLDEGSATWFRSNPLPRRCHDAHPRQALGAGEHATAGDVIGAYGWRDRLGGPMGSTQEAKRIQRPVRIKRGAGWVIMACSYAREASRLP
jgi:hypothetical protein